MRGVEMVMSLVQCSRGRAAYSCGSSYGVSPYSLRALRGGPVNAGHRKTLSYDRDPGAQEKPKRDRRLLRRFYFLALPRGTHLLADGIAAFASCAFVSCRGAFADSDGGPLDPAACLLVENHHGKFFALIVNSGSGSTWEGLNPSGSRSRNLALRSSGLLSCGHGGLPGCTQIDNRLTKVMAEYTRKALRKEGRLNGNGTRRCCFSDVPQAATRLLQDC